MDVTTRFTNTDYDLIKDYVHCAKAAFGAFIPIHVRERPEKTKSGATAWDVDIHSVVIRTFLAELGLPYSRAADKTVPWSILQSSTHNAKHFIRAYLDGDGHILRKSSTPGFSSSSLRLLRQLQVLLLRFGVVSCLNKPRRIDDNFWRCGKLHVHSIYADIYAKVVGFGFKKFQAPRRRIEFGGIPYVQEYVVFKSTGLRSKHYHLSLREYLKRRSAGTRSPYRHQIRHDQLQGFLDDSDWLDLDPSVYHTLKEISDAGFIWQRVTDISRAKSTVTYDVTLPACGRLPHSFQANGFVVHNSAQALSVTLDYDHHSPLSEVIGRWETMIREWLPNAKLGAYRIAAGPGSVGVRPLRLSWTSRVFKIGSSNNPMGDLVNLMSALGLP
jgi:intein/homing endonuclease